MVSDLRLTQYQLPALLGMPVAGLLWSLATLHARRDLVASLDIGPGEAFMLISLGGLAQTLAVWVGLATVCWAMIRAFGGALALLRLGALISSAALPLWVGAPIAAYLTQGAAGPASLAVGVLLASIAGFFWILAQSLCRELGWPLWRAASVLGATLTFLASFIFLSL